MRYIALSFVWQSALEANAKVFVHCQHGVSRSASICLAYLMWRERYTYEEALDQLRRVRPTVNPNIGFACALLAWGELVGQTSLDGGDIFRILRRTTDLLRQVALVPYVSETVQTRARDAYRAMSRYPLGTVGDPVVLEAEGEGAAVKA